MEPEPDNIERRRGKLTVLRRVTYFMKAQLNGKLAVSGSVLLSGYNNILPIF